MIPRAPLFSIFLAILVSLFAAWVIESFGFDFWVQDHLFTHGQGWFVKGEDFVLRMIFYKGPKYALIGFFLMVGMYAGYDAFKNGRKLWHKRFFFVMLCFVVISISISLLKECTFVYCPAQLISYGGERVFRPLLDLSNVPAWDCRGKCFPAGHATAGFAFMSLYYVFDKKIWKGVALALGVLLGMVLSFYQMAKGAHFLSHSIATMGLSWAMISAIHYAMMHPKDRFPKKL